MVEDDKYKNKEETNKYIKFEYDDSPTLKKCFSITNKLN